MISKSGLYAYGVVGKSPQHLDIKGIDKKNKVYPVLGEGSCVIVSEVDINQLQSQVQQLVSALEKSNEALQDATEEILQAHEDVVETLMKETTIVPFKFGTILRDEQAATRLLQDEGETFKKLLTKFTGRAEWGLKVYADKQALMKHIMQVEPRFKSLEEQRQKLPRGAAYLLGKKIDEEAKEHMGALIAQVTEEIFQDLARDAFEAKLNDVLPQKVTGRNKEMILNAAYLVEGDKVANLRQRGKSFMEKYEFMGLDAEFSGPWPPYNFT